MSSFQERIQAALDRRELILPPLVALADELPSGFGQSDLRELINLLQSQPNADAWIEHPRAAAWLPVIVGSVCETDCRNETDATQRIGTLLHEALRQQIRRRSVLPLYPLVVLALAVSVAVGLSWFVVPSFAEMFDDFRLDLPAPTAGALWVSNQIVHHPARTLLTLLIAVVIVGWAVRWWLHSAMGSRLFGSLVTGSAPHVQAMAKLTGSLAEMLSVGASLPWALRIAGRGCGHRLYQQQLELLAVACETTGEPLAEAGASRWLPANVLVAMQPMAGGAPNVELLRSLSTLYHERAQQRVDLWRWLAGPISVLAVGLIVGFVVIALFMPLVSLISGLS